MNENSDFDIDALSETWRSDAGPDLNSIRSDVRTALMRERVIFGIEAIVAVAGLVAGGLLLAGGAFLPGIATLAFAGFAGVAAVIARGRSWRVSLDAVTSELAKLEAEALNLKRTGWAGLWICAAALVFVAVLIVGETASVTTQSRLIVAGALIFIAVNILFSSRTLVVASRRIEKIRRLRAAYPEHAS